MRKILFTALTIVLTVLQARAEQRLTIDLPYLSGPARLAQAKAHHVIAIANAAALGFVEVPLDYARPERGTTQIFYRLPRALNPAWPTMIFFSGGPGVTSLSSSFERSLQNINLVYFDQRGSGYSYLPSLSAQMNASYYSSEFSARDAERVLNQLGVTRLGVYGHSYGTVVATIFAHLFPERVTGLVLEGTIFDGRAQSEADLERQSDIQAFFDQLPAAERAQILALSRGGELPKDWFSRVVKPAMYENEFAPDLKAHLATVLAQSHERVIAEVQDEILEFLDHDDINFAAMMSAILSCRELSLGDAHGGWASEFEGEHLVPSLNNQASFCREFSVKPVPYSAAREPITVPVTYFQGTTDGATPMIGALTHAMVAAKGEMQYVRVPDGGHTSVLGLLFDPIDVAKSTLATKLVLQALAGQTLDANTVEALGWQKLDRAGVTRAASEIRARLTPSLGQ